MQHFAFYSDGGRIDWVLSAPSSDYANMQGGDYLPCDELVSDDAHYVAGGEILPKQTLDTSHQVSGLEVVFSALPQGLLIEVAGESMIAEGGNDSIEFELPGTYRVRLFGSVPHLDQELEVTVDG